MRGHLAMILSIPRRARWTHSYLTANGLRVAKIHGDIWCHGSANASWTRSRTWILNISWRRIYGCGIDIEGVSHVINDAIPQDLSFFVHRVGRTGRNGLSGIAITLPTQWRCRYSRVGKAQHSAFQRKWKMGSLSIPKHVIVGLIVKKLVKNWTWKWLVWSKRVPLFRLIPRKGEPLYIPSDDIVHTLITAPYKSRKGIHIFWYKSSWEFKSGKRFNCNWPKRRWFFTSNHKRARKSKQK